MKNTFTFFFICLSNFAIAQCVGSPIFDNCQDAPVNCDFNDINGFQGCTPEYDGMVQGSMCSGQAAVHNPAYFSFVAASTFIEVSIGVDNCDMVGGFSGLQANVIDYCTPDICYGDSGGSCFDEDFSFTADDLIIGEVYQLIVDGCNGNVCDFSINIESAPPFELPSINAITTNSSCSETNFIIEQGATIIFETIPIGLTPY